MLEAILEPIDIERKLFVSYLDTGVARHQVSFSDFLSLFPDNNTYWCSAKHVEERTHYVGDQTGNDSNLK